MLNDCFVQCLFYISLVAWDNEEIENSNYENRVIARCWCKP
jgi:hypothetical protein